MELKKGIAGSIFLCCIVIVSFAQVNDTTINTLQRNEQSFYIGNGKFLVYPKPRSFAFITQLPKATTGLVSTTFSKKSIKPLVVIAAATGLLILADEDIANGVQQFSTNINLDATEKNKNIWIVNLGGKSTTIIKAPGNINTALYQIGQGFPGLILGAGMFVYGKIKDNYRATSTASQLAETFILMGVTTQVLKRITGRQSPLPGNENSNQWHFLPSFSAFQKHTPMYDAFPSGHLATLMSTVTVFTENYPEMKWIKPVGYSLTGLVGLAMINNDAHWASDYPLALGLGYLCAKVVAKINRYEVTKNGTVEDGSRSNFSFNYANGRAMIVCIYKL